MKTKTSRDYINYFIIFLLFVNYNISLVSQNSLDIHVSNEQQEKVKLESFNKCDISVSQDSSLVQINDSILFNILPKELSPELYFHDFDFKLRNINKIKAVKLILNGYISKKGTIKDNRISLTNGVEYLTDNMANKNLKGKRWPVETNAKEWIYYFDMDSKWFDKISTDKFGAKIVLKNTSKDTIKVVIQDVKIEVQYFQLVSFCKDELFTLYVDYPGPGYTYYWDLPEGASITSPDKNDYIINAVFTNDDFGIKEIKIIAEKNDTRIDGFQNILYNDCRISRIEGSIWLDNNCNGYYDTLDIGLDSMNLALYSDEAYFEQVSDSLGHFSFDSIISNFYELTLFNGTQYSPISENLGNFSEAMNSGFSASIFVEPGVVLDTFDFGFVENIKLQGNLFEDYNGNFVRDYGDSIGLRNIPLFISNRSGLEKSCESDSLGNFVFEKMIPGSYSLCVSEDSGWIVNTDTNKYCIDIDFECGEGLKRMDFGLYGYGDISGILWMDVNGNGVRDTSEELISDIWLNLIDTTSVSIQSVKSDSLGKYIFLGIKPGEYKIILNSPPAFRTTLFNIGNDSLDNDFFSTDSMAYSGNIFVHSREKVLNIDCGFVYKKCSIGDFVWLDENGNNLQDVNEKGVSGIEIQLLDKDSIKLKSVFSADSLPSKGSYLFNDLVSGRYYIKVILPEEYVFIDSNMSDDKLNSDIMSQNGFSRPIELEPGEINTDIDIGIRFNTGKVETFAWLDANNNGIQDTNEAPIEGIGLILENVDSSEVVSTGITDNTGKVIFEDVVQGKYLVVVDTINEKYKLADYKVGQNDSIDSDFELKGNQISSAIFNVYPGETNNDIDLGLTYNFGGISGYLWNDTNRDGTYDATEELLRNIEVELYDINESIDNPVSTTLSGDWGRYEFSGLKKSVYFIKFIGDLQYSVSLNGGEDNNISNENGPGTTDSIFIDWGSEISNVNGAFILNKSAIGDLVWLDENSNGLQDSGEKGVNNVLIQLYDFKDSLIKEVLSDELGRYLITDIDTGKYYLKFVCDSMYKFTIPKLNNPLGSKVINTGNEGVTNHFTLEPGGNNLDLDAGLVINYCSIGDFVWLDENKSGVYDTGEKALNSIKLELVNIENNITRSIFTDENGLYKFDSLVRGNYFLRIPQLPDTLDFSNNYGLKSDITNLNGQNTTSTFYLKPGNDYEDFDIALIKKTGVIGDRIWLDSNENGIQDPDEEGINDIRIILYDILGDEIAQTSTSDNNGEAGFYKFEVGTGFYFLRFVLPFEYISTIAKKGNDRDLDSDITGANGYNTTDLFYMQAGQFNTDIDAGLVYKKASIGGWIWEDINKNGLLESAEPKIDSIKVNLYSKDGDLVNSTLSSLALNGRYEFKNIIPGNYYLVFDIPDRFIPTEPYIGTDKDKDSDITGYFGKGSTDMLTILPGENSFQYSAGLIHNSKSEISGRVWLDTDENGIMDSLENGINEVEVRLYKLNGALYGKTITETDTLTGIDGIYHFVDVPEDTFYIQFINQIGYFFTNPDVGNNDSLDSDVNSIIDFGSTDTIFITGYLNLKNINAGFVLDSHGSIGDRLWEDMNGNGIQDNGEPGINGALIRLFREGDGVVGALLTKTNEDTGEDGYYKFDNLISGKYFIEIHLPGNFQLTNPSKGSDTNLDSDITDDNGINTSPTINLGVNEIRNDIDIGAFHLGQAGDFVWLDENENGIQDPGENGKRNIFISIYDENGDYVTTTISDQNGNYLSDLLRPGKYFIKVLGYSKSSFTPGKIGADYTKDSDITNENGDATSSLFQIESGTVNPDIDVGILPGTNTNLIVFPNPVKDKMKLAFITSEIKDVDIYVKGLNNEKVKKIHLVSKIGTNIIYIDLADLKLGYYRLILKIGNEIKDEKTVLKLE